MRIVVVVIGLWVSFFSPVIHAGGGEGWDKLGTKSGVQVERKVMPNSPLFAFRGEGLFDVDIGRLVSVLKNPHIAVEWVDLMTEHSVVRQEGPSTNLIYESYGLPWPISDRDYLMHENYNYDEEKKVFSIRYESVEDSSKPPREDHVRAMAFRTYWRLTKVDQDTTRVEVEVFTDPKGALPAWLINLIQKDWPWKTIDGLVKRAQKGDVSPDEIADGW